MNRRISQAALLLTLAAGVVSPKVSPVSIRASGDPLRILSSHQMYPNRISPGSHRIRKTSDTPSDDYTFDTFQFLNELEGWIASRGKPFNTKDGTLAVEGKLWRTRDGGQSWKLVFEDSIDSFQFISPRFGWRTALGRIYKTEDGGATWSLLKQPIRRGYSGGVAHFKFLNDGRHGWATGGIYIPIAMDSFDLPPPRYTSDGGKNGVRGAIFHTSDGGKNWQLQFLTKTWGPIGELSFGGAGYGVAIGTAGLFYFNSGIWKSTESRAIDEDGQRLTMSLTNEIGAPTIGPESIFCLGSELCWLSNNNGYVGRSTDGGKTWQDIADLRDNANNVDWPVRYFRKLYFSDANHGIALDSEGLVHETNDGGQSWRQIESNVKFDDIYFLGPRQGWGLSKKGLFRIEL